MSQHTGFTVTEVNFFHFSNAFSNCVDKARKVSKTFNERTGKRSVKTNLSLKNEKNSINSSTFNAYTCHKKFINSVTTVDGLSTQDLKKLEMMMILCLFIQLI